MMNNYYAIFRLKNGTCTSTVTCHSYFIFMRACEAYRVNYENSIMYEYHYNGFEQIDAIDHTKKSEDSKDFWDKIEVNKGIDPKKYKN